MKNPISFISYQDSDEVTGSKHFLKIKDKYILVDYGMWQGSQEETQKNRDFVCPVSLDEIRTVILTHAHADHCALIPKLVKDGYQGKIRSTPATRDLASIVMLDSAKIQRNDSSKPMYTENDAILAINQFRCHFYHKEKLLDDGVKVTFYDAGHILGSALVDISIKKTKFLDRLLKKKPIHILFTGDLGRDSNPITNPPETSFPAPDYIVLESTYGNRTHAESNTTLKEFANIINRTIEREGKIIIPAFAIERSQEIIYHLKTMMKDGLIPRIPVYVDSPMAINATGIFNIHPECFNKKINDDFIAKGKNPFSISSLHCLNDNADSIKVAKSKKPCIVLAASGMCEGGRILNHLKFGVESSRNTILLVGYVGEHTLGRDIAEKNPIITINEKEYKLNAEVHTLSAFSSHSDFKETLEWLSKVDTSKLKKIFLVHGDKESRQFLRDVLISKNYKNVEIVEKGKEYNLS